VERVRQSLDRVRRTRLEEQRPAAVERELEGDRYAPGPWVLQRRDQVRELTDLPTAVLDSLSRQRHLRRPSPDRAGGVVDCTVERGRDPTPHAALQEMVGTRLMGRAGRGANAGCQLRVEVGGLDHREEVSEYLRAGSMLVLPPFE
jgi:hypothetical protein